MDWVTIISATHWQIPSVRKTLENRSKVGCCYLFVHLSIDVNGEERLFKENLMSLKGSWLFAGTVYSWCIWWSMLIVARACLWRTQKARPSLMAQPSAESPNRYMLVWAEEVNTNDRWSALITDFKIWLQTWVDDSTCNNVVSPKSRHLPSKTSWSRKLETKISHCWTTLTSNSSLTWSPTWRFTYVLLQSLDI